MARNPTFARPQDDFRRVFTRSYVRLDCASRFQTKWTRFRPFFEIGEKMSGWCCHSATPADP